MKTSLSWLQSHLDLTGKSIDEWRDLLTFAGIEVEGVEQQGVETDLVVIAQVTSFEPHPNADRLRVCQVNDGSPELRQIVCGAKNFKVGDKVPLALPGSKLPGGIEIKAGKLRDVVSNGMLCSGEELGIPQEDEGLLILDAALPVGRPIREFYPSDIIFDLEITPNRSDLLSHTGLARELSALTKSALTATKPLADVPVKPAADSEVKLSAPEAGPLYSARLIQGVKVGPSPEWLQQRLQSVGLRPINNVVDITNYVLMEVGQPLHAFDADKLKGGIEVRQAQEGETIVALDDNTYTLRSIDLVIADEAKAVAIAGVMGGAETAVTETTVNVLLEAAYFTPSGIRRTSRDLGLSSDSSYRFERGIDPQRVLAGSALAAQLIQEIAGGSAAPEVSVAGTPPVLVQPVGFDETRARQLIGAPDLTQEEMHGVLTSLGLVKLSSTAEASRWEIPSYRLDLLRSVDLVEEIARVIGLDRIPARTAGAYLAAQNPDRAYDFGMNVRQALVQRGFYEAQTLRLISSAQLPDALGPAIQPEKAVQVKNPLSADHTILRPSLIPGLLATAGLNLRQGQQRLRFFELGRVFISNPNGSNREEERLGVLLGGPTLEENWDQKDVAVSTIHTLRGVLDALPGLAGQALELVPKPLPGWLLSAEIKRGSKTLGWISQVHPSRARQLDTRHPLYVAELTLSALQQGATAAVKFTELPRFPSITRDVAFELPADFPHAKVAAFFTGHKEPLLIGAELFDLFIDPTGQKLASDKKSVAWSLTYRASDRTLESKEVEVAHDRLLKALVGTLPATIR